MSRTPGLAPRFAAWRVLHDVRHGVPFDTALNRAIRDLEPEDRRLAHELAAGVFRHRSRLDAAIRPAVARGLDRVRPDLLDVLRIGAFQLLELDRVPPHAAVQTTVGIARRLGGRRVAGFVNAVLRRLADQTGPEAPAAKAAEPEHHDPARALAEQHSHPVWLVERWLARFGLAETERLLAWNNARPPLVLQPARWSADELTTALDAAGLAWERSPFDAGLAVRARRPAEVPGFAAGGFLVQDPAQLLVCRFFDPPLGATILDACAAPGGKSLILARRARLVVAADRHRRRIRRLEENLNRAGSGRVIPLVADALHPPVRPVEVVVLDTPCLGTGTFARNPDARWRATPTALERLTEQAARLLDALAAVVRPGGLLLFATCSLEPEENSEQIDRFLARNARFQREPGLAAPTQLLTPDGDLMILPQRDGMDGAFAARLRRVGT